MGYARKIQILALGALFLPAMTHAVDSPKNLNDLLDIFTEIIGILIPLIFLLIFFTISWGVIKAWIMGDASSDTIDGGKKIVVVGVVVLAIMVSIWGIVRMLQTTFFG